MYVETSCKTVGKTTLIPISYNNLRFKINIDLLFPYLIKQNLIQTKLQKKFNGENYTQYWLRALKINKNIFTFIISKQL